MKLVKISVLLMLLLTSILFGCEEEDAATNGVSSPAKTDTPANDLIIKIGNLTDLTGPGASGMELVNMALEDSARYANDTDLVPGVQFEVIHWDGQTDPSRTVPGYEWLQHRGVDLMTTCAPGVAVTLKSRVEADKMVLFSQIAELESMEPPGWVFCSGPVPQHEAYTFLNWIAEHHWDYRKNGPAKIGGAAWKESYSEGFLQAVEDYSKAHPEQFEFTEAYLADFKFNWSSEIEQLKDCDYIFPPMIMHEFAKSVRKSGSQATFIGGTTHTAFLKQAGEAGAWPAIDGMLFIYTGPWWSEDVEENEFHRAVLTAYHAGEEQDIMDQGSAYGACGSYVMLFDIVRETVDRTGLDGFNAEAFYETAQTWSYSWENRPRGYNFTQTKRYFINDLCVLEASANSEDLIRNDTNWYPIITEP